MPGLYVGNMQATGSGGHQRSGLFKKTRRVRIRNLVRFGPDCIWGIGPPVCCPREDPDKVTCI